MYVKACGTLNIPCALQARFYSPSLREGRLLLSLRLFSHTSVSSQEELQSYHWMDFHEISYSELILKFIKALPFG